MGKFVYFQPVKTSIFRFKIQSESNQQNKSIFVNNEPVVGVINTNFRQIPKSLWWRSNGRTDMETLQFMR